MSSAVPKGFAFNRTRSVYLAKNLQVADTHWTRLRGLMARDPDDFPEGQGLWIVPCRGVHTMGMRFPIDVVYLDGEETVVHVEEDLRPWRFAPIRIEARSVLELPRTTVSFTRTVVGDKIEIDRHERL
ncbi:MAG TPA: DUF192 domain-containing protein [Terriglobales bacterium]|nr:DUF192 domain-containing protein [Terriglobales bacterium]